MPSSTIQFTYDKNLLVSKLSDKFDLTTFTCGRNDIDEFLKDDALNYQNEKLANTYLIHSKENVIVGYFSILNDSLNATFPLLKKVTSVLPPPTSIYK